MASHWYILAITVLLCVLDKGYCIQCFQCDSNEDIACPAGEPFDTSVNAIVDCNSFEAVVPGQFCMKIIQESPGWRGWKKITRRCGSRTDFGVAWGCRWSWDYTGVFKETCYCEDRDGCNGASNISSNLLIAVISNILTVLYLYLK